MIGSYFNVWPDECLTVEADLAPDTFGRLVMAENKNKDSEDELSRDLGYSPFAVRAQMVEAVRMLVLEGVQTTGVKIAEKNADMLLPVRSFSETHATG